MCFWITSGGCNTTSRTHGVEKIHCAGAARCECARRPGASLQKRSTHRYAGITLGGVSLSLSDDADMQVCRHLRVQVDLDGVVSQRLDRSRDDDLAAINRLADLILNGLSDVGT